MPESPPAVFPAHRTKSPGRRLGKSKSHPTIDNADASERKRRTAYQSPGPWPQNSFCRARKDGWPFLASPPLHLSVAQTKLQYPLRDAWRRFLGYSQLLQAPKSSPIRADRIHRTNVQASQEQAGQAATQSQRSCRALLQFLPAQHKP